MVALLALTRLGIVESGDAARDPQTSISRARPAAYHFHIKQQYHSEQPCKMDFESLKSQVSNLTLYDLKAGVRKVQNGMFAV